MVDEREPGRGWLGLPRFGASWGGAGPLSSTSISQPVFRVLERPIRGWTGGGGGMMLAARDTGGPWGLGEDRGNHDDI